MGGFGVVGKVATLPSADGVDDNADVANCGKPADTYAAAKFGSGPVYLLRNVQTTNVNEKKKRREEMTMMILVYVNMHNP